MRSFHLADIVGHFWCDRRGNAATVMALVAIPVVMGVAGAIEFSRVGAAKARLQDAVDAAALAGAGQLAMATTGQGMDSVIATAVGTARTNLSDVPDLASADITASIATDQSEITVAAVYTHKAVFELVPINQTLKVSATAENLGSMPLCVLQTGVGGLILNNQSVIRATGCAVHANDRIDISGQGFLQAGRIQAVNDVTGATQPKAQTGALSIPDPFETLDLKAPLPCLNLPLKPEIVLTSVTYLPGVHCELIRVAGSGRVTLLPGEHYFMQPLELIQNSTLIGDDVVLIFDTDKSFSFGDRATVQLGARKSGKFAGFLIASSRDNTHTFKISSDNVSQLLGTIYIPSAELEVSAQGQVAQNSAWSVIVAKAVKLTNNPTLVINKNYVGSGVPVPQGVGPNASKPVLIK